MKCSLNSTLTRAEDIEKRGKELKKMGKRKKKSLESAINKTIPQTPNVAESSEQPPTGEDIAWCKSHLGICNAHWLTKKIEARPSCCSEPAPKNTEGSKEKGAV